MTLSRLPAWNEEGKEGEKKRKLCHTYLLILLKDIEQPIEERIETGGFRYFVEERRFPSISKEKIDGNASLIGRHLMPIKNWNEKHISCVEGTHFCDSVFKVREFLQIRFRNVHLRLEK